LGGKAVPWRVTTRLALLKSSSDSEGCADSHRKSALAEDWQWTKRDDSLLRQLNPGPLRLASWNTSACQPSTNSTLQRINGRSSGNMPKPEA
jgi:hypothetical protein